MGGKKKTTGLGTSKSYCEVEGYGQIACRCTKLAAKKSAVICTLKTKDRNQET